MSKFVATPIVYSIHLESESPIFGESSTHVIIDDNGAGPFVKLEQCDDNIKDGEVSMDLEVLELAFQVAQRMIDQINRFSTK